MDWDNEFHNLEAELQIERPYSTIRDLGIDKSPFSDDLSMRLWVIKIGFNKLLIYAGVRLFKALQVNTALM